jgi:hypothetical protein
MMTTIPEVLHICKRCGALASGECESCAEVRAINERLEAALHARRAAALANSLPRVTAPAAEFEGPRWYVHVGSWAAVILAVAFCWILFPVLALAGVVWFNREDPLAYEPLG